ncbi:hypothetical protein [Actinoplanes sp. N902-109]|uniref:hypothetical protein n=1 Tax=Actinoplanes sp. (strain N902-109) TaxID=649831 RepID=UPI0003294E07|nr:hypothetical protein [Actinoplanes sp. N902-109]AGL18237.1 hypothetical protein L083_4727 [Actinoplanes sp. N902-109]
MSAGGGARTVTTRYVWLPHGGSSGWLLVHRSIAGDELTHDFWITGEISPEDAGDVLKDSPEGWTPLVLGEQINFLLRPYVLTAVTGKQLRKVREQLLLTEVRPLADISVTVLDGPAGPLATEPAIVLADDPFAPRHEDLELGEHWTTGPLDPSARRAALLAVLSSRITAGAGPAGPVTVNRFVTHDDHARTALDEVLARRAVRSAVAAVLADPGADEPRERLVDELRGHGWQFAAVPLVLPAAAKPGLLERLVLVLAATGTGQATCRFVTLPATAALLHDQGLTGTLAAHLAPLDPELRPEPARLADALAAVPCDWDPRHERGLHLAPPDADEITTVPGDRPVTIGDARPTRIHHVELFDSQGVAQGVLDLSAAPRGEHQSPGVAP